MKILVTGDREWTNKNVIRSVLVTLPRDTVIIHGYARGADTLADEVARECGFTVIRCPAHWSHTDKKWVEVYGECKPDCREMVGRPAGVIRNKKMADTHHPDGIMAFHNDIDNSRGTKHMVEYGKRLKIPYQLFTDKKKNVLADLYFTKK